MSSAQSSTRQPTAQQHAGRMQCNQANSEQASNGQRAYRKVRSMASICDSRVSLTFFSDSRIASSLQAIIRIGTREQWHGGSECMRRQSQRTAIGAPGRPSCRSSRTQWQTCSRACAATRTPMHHTYTRRRRLSPTAEPALNARLTCPLICCSGVALRALPASVASGYRAKSASCTCATQSPTVSSCMPTTVSTSVPWRARC